MKATWAPSRRQLLDRTPRSIEDGESLWSRGVGSRRTSPVPKTWLDSTATSATKAAALNPDTR